MCLCVCTRVCMCICVCCVGVWLLNCLSFLQCVYCHNKIMTECFIVRWMKAHVHRPSLIGVEYVFALNYKHTSVSPFELCYLGNPYYLKEIFIITKWCGYKIIDLFRNDVTLILYLWDSNIFKYCFLWWMNYIVINNQDIKAKQPGMVIKQIKEYYICSSNKTSQKTKTHLYEYLFALAWYLLPGIHKRSIFIYRP